MADAIDLRARIEALSVLESTEDLALETFLLGEGLDLLHHYRCISDASVRAAVLVLVKSAAKRSDGSAAGQE